MEKSNGVIVASAIGAGLLAGYFIWQKLWKQRKWKEVATVAEMYLYPVKSCRGMRVESFPVRERGIVASDGEIGDRTFMVVYGEGQFGRIANVPRMVLIKPTIISENSIKLEAPGMKPIEVTTPSSGNEMTYTVYDSKVPGIDCGEEVAVWLEEFLKIKSPRLVFHPTKLPFRESHRFVKFGHLGWYDKPLSLVFHNYTPFNMVSQASIDVLNTKFNDGYKVTARNFRPNLVLKGCDAFAEDNWKRIRIGSAEFIFIRHCTRCQTTTVDPETGFKDPEQRTLTTLLQFRSCTPEEQVHAGNSPKFTVDFLCVKDGWISTADKVYVEEV